jgi:outer membrane protein assembly factor BamB
MIDGYGVLVHSASGHDVDTVIVDGRVVLAGGRLTLADGDVIVAGQVAGRLTVLRLDGASGAVDWNTFLGAWDANAIALHGGSVYVACAGDGTWGAPVRPYTGGFDGCVASLDAATGALGWNTFLGGSGDDGSNGIAVDATGRVFVSGSSESTWGAPVRPFTGGTDGFVAQLDPAGTLVWNTFLGGAGVDQISPIAIDGNGRVLVGGSSDASWGNPLRPYSAGTDAFVASVDPGSGALGWNLFLGGAGNDRAGLLLASGPGEIYVAGTSSAPWGSPLRAFTAVQDGFLARLAVPTAVPAVAPRGLVLLALVLAGLGLLVARRPG